ncbi:methyltransferase domain-containing protein [Pelagibius litoralis]|uniref:Methyltransferase domain-containing protein n=2 Tax=Pelagibius litoralis TaxID=374515 RepID=A0A967KAW6_9PROT|nr:methyltransferase domain-containing protein [Pelagibius litoralis]
MIAPEAPALNARVLDLACGSGRHSRLLLGLGHQVLAVDRDISGLGELAGQDRMEALQCDLETGETPTFLRRSFDAIVVTNYLYRPLFPALLGALAPGGLLIYETFALGNERFGRPSNPDFLLRPGELLDWLRNDLRILAYEDLEVALPKPAAVQRVCAKRV